MKVKLDNGTMVDIEELYNDRLHFLYFDNLYELEGNPILKLYYYIRMRGVELWIKLKQKKRKW